jgi:hypothetical protein
MSDISGSWRDFASCVPKDPPEVTSRFRLVAVIPRQNFESEKKVLNQAEELVPQWISASQEEPNHRIVDRNNQGCVRFTPKIVIGKEVGEQVPILENWINRATEKTGLAANLAYCIPINGGVPADYERFGVHCSHPMGIALDFLVGPEATRRPLLIPGFFIDQPLSSL